VSSLALWGAGARGQLPWVSLPSARHWENGQALLQQLGGLEATAGSGPWQRWQLGPSRLAHMLLKARLAETSWPVELRPCSTARDPLSLPAGSVSAQARIRIQRHREPIPQRPSPTRTAVCCGVSWSSVIAQ